MSCTHLDEIQISGLPAEIEECLKTGGWWVHLRRCYVDQIAFELR